jgi:hypothetical protein
MAVYGRLIEGTILISLLGAVLTCFYAVGRVFSGEPDIWAFVLPFVLVMNAFLFYRSCSSRKTEIVLKDELVNEPTLEEILDMSSLEASNFIQNARMKEGCKPDVWENRAKIRACYLIKEAYKIGKKP